MSKELKELDVLSNSMMNAIANDPDVSEPFFRLLLSILLEIEIGRITVQAQSVVPGDMPKLRGIRLDVEVTEHLEENGKTANCRIYNVEPQLYVDNLPKRSRFYQAKKDSKRLKREKKIGICSLTCICLLLLILIRLERIVWCILLRIYAGNFLTWNIKMD